MNVVAKFKCESIQESTNPDGTINSKSITMRAVVGYDENGNRLDENESWSKWTPSGQLTINITNPDAYNQFEQGQDYYLTFEKAEMKHA